MNVLSLFSGIGGLDLGLQRAGMTIVGHVEIDPYCRRVLTKHWPEVPAHDDVRTAPEWWTQQPRPRVDLVAGGFPCQGHSVAGKQLGTADERWGWPWYRDVIDALDPPLVLIENVPNLTRTGLRDVLIDLAGRGFDAWWVRVPAAAVGAPHLRWRLFTIAAHPERVELRHEPGRGSRQDGTGQTVVGHDGATWSLANAGCPVWGQQRPGSALSGTGSSALGVGAAQPGRRGGALADPPGIERGTRRAGRPAFPGEPWDELASPGLVSERGADGLPANEWDVEPNVGRVAHGVPARMDRLRGLGNAVVPQVAEYVGRLVLASVESLSLDGAA